MDRRLSPVVLSLVVLAAGLGLGIDGCEDRVIIGNDNGGNDGERGEPCGPTTCPVGEVCCNESCGICTPPDGACILIACTDAGSPPGTDAGSGEACDGDTCGAAEYCDFPDGDACGARGSSGECRPRPTICLTDCPEVCGCDGRTYCNDCVAAGSGTDVAHDGPCEPEAREPVSGDCYRTVGHTCDTDADCTTGGCGNEVCYNRANPAPDSTCDCTMPTDADCGCVKGQCVWFR